jgi:PDZ domain
MRRQSSAISYQLLFQEYVIMMSNSKSPVRCLSPRVAGLVALASFVSHSLTAQEVRRPPDKGAVVDSIQQLRLHVRRMIDSMKYQEKPSPDRVWFGFSIMCGRCTMTETRSGTRWEFSTPPSIRAVEPDGPAQRAGLLSGDVLTRIDGLDLTSDGGADRLATARIGQTVRFTVQRGRQTLGIAVTAGSYREIAVTPQAIKVNRVQVEANPKPLRLVDEPIEWKPSGVKRDYTADSTIIWRKRADVAVVKVDPMRTDSTLVAKKAPPSVVEVQKAPTQDTISRARQRHAEAELADAQRELERARQLYQNGRLSQQELEKREVALEKARAGRVLAAQADVEETQRQVERGAVSREELDRAQMVLQKARMDWTVPPAQQPVRFSGSFGNSDITVRGAGNTTVTIADRECWMEIRSSDAVVRLQLRDGCTKKPPPR